MMKQFFATATWNISVQIKKLSYSRAPWRLITDDGREVCTRQAFDHADIGITLINATICGDTKTECTDKALALLERMLTPNTVDDFPDLPTGVRFGVAALFTVDQMHAYVLADRAQRPASPAVAGSVDTPDFWRLVSAHGHAVATPDRDSVAAKLIAHINARLASERQEGRRDAHETNITLLGENCKLADIDVQISAELTKD